MSTCLPEAYSNHTHTAGIVTVLGLESYGDAEPEVRSLVSSLTSRE